MHLSSIGHSTNPRHAGRISQPPCPKGTKRIGETNRMVWKSRKRVGGRGRKAVGILPFPPPTTGATSLETGEKGNAAFSFSPGTYFAADGNRFKPVWMYIQKDGLNLREWAAIMM